MDRLESKINELITSFSAGNRKSLAKLISLAENESMTIPEILKIFNGHLGKAYSIGITGPPGVGKSTIVNRLTKKFREHGLSVGIIAVDPSSSISGGALLGDRIRMREHYLDDGVFIRSMATRGECGGLSSTASSAVKLMDAFGKDIIIIETVGVGQTELSIVKISDIIILVLVPESGDNIQAMKAGVIEFADIIVVNKADREGAGRLSYELRDVFSDVYSKHQPLIMITQAINDNGVTELYQEIENRRSSYLKYPS